MKKLIIALAAIALVGSTVGSASAACDFNGINVKGFKIGLIRSFADCPSTETGGSINTQTSTGTPACTPVLEKADSIGQTSDYSFSDRGGCAVSVKAKAVKDCSKLKFPDKTTGADAGIPAEPCGESVTSIKCKGILGLDGLTPIDGTQDGGWQFNILASTHVSEETENRDITIIPFSVAYVLSPPKKGGLRDSFSTAQFVAGLGSSLPQCTTVAIENLQLIDPDGAPFAEWGYGSVDKF